MIDDNAIRQRLEALGMVDSAPVTRGNPSKFTPRKPRGAERRGTDAFDDLLEEMLEEWEVENDVVDNIVELRRAGDSFEYRLKGEDEFELLVDEDEDEDDSSEEE